MLKLWERKAEGEGKGKTHPPGVNGDKGGGGSGLNHSEMSRPGERATRATFTKPSYRRLHISKVSTGSQPLCYTRGVCQLQHTRGAWKRQRQSGGWKESWCLPISGWPLSPAHTDSLIPAQTTGPGGPLYVCALAFFGFIADINGKLNILRSKTDEEGILVFYWWMVQTP